MGAVRNVLFVMCDQLRRDHLSCYGGRVHTPHLDALAARGVRVTPNKIHVTLPLLFMAVLYWLSSLPGIV